MQTVKLTSRREVAPAVYELLFTRPEGWTFDAGQFARIGLATDGDEPVFRAYSIAGSPKAEGLRFLVKSVEGGALSPRLCAPQSGRRSPARRRSPGNLLPARIPGGDTVWMLATGSGLCALHRHDGRRRHAWRLEKSTSLVIGARTREEVDRLAAYAESEARIPLTILTAASREAGELTGRIPALIESGALEAKAGAAFTPESARLLLCGNPDFIRETRALMKARGIVSPRLGKLASFSWNPFGKQPFPRQTHDYA